jgi:hypothetical protein
MPNLQESGLRPEQQREPELDYGILEGGVAQIICNDEDRLIEIAQGISGELGQHLLAPDIEALREHQSVDLDAGYIIERADDETLLVMSQEPENEEAQSEIARVIGLVIGD